MSEYSGNERKKHGNLWYGWQRLRGVIHNRKRIGGEFANIRTNGFMAVAGAAGAVLSLPLMYTILIGAVPLAATPVALAGVAVYNGYKAASRSKGVFHHTAVNSYVSAKERGQKLFAATSYGAKPAKGAVYKNIALGAGAVVLSGAAVVAVMDGKIDMKKSFDAAKDAVVDTITGSMTPKSASVAPPAQTSGTAATVEVKPLPPSASVAP